MIGTGRRNCAVPAPPSPAPASPVAPGEGVAPWPGPVILFDGVCNLCAGAVQFIIKRDPEGKIRFASLQSPIGQRLMSEHGLPPDQLDSFVLIENGRACTESTAALRTARHLTGLWPACHICIILPHFVRDPMYRFIARRRYRWFGKQESCLMPTPELRTRFLG